MAQTPEEAKYLQEIHSHANLLDIPTRFISKSEHLTQEPEVLAREAILESPSTGILDSHGLMLYLLTQFEDCGGDLALNTSVTAISARQSGGYEITFRSGDGEESMIEAGVVVNSAGLYACQVANMLLPEGERQVMAYYAKGNYFSYSAGFPKPKRLIYPCPKKNFAGSVPENTRKQLVFLSSLTTSEKQFVSCLSLFENTTKQFLSFPSFPLSAENHLPFSLLY